MKLGYSRWHRGNRVTLGQHAALMIVAMAAATGAAAEVPKNGLKSVLEGTRWDSAGVRIAPGKQKHRMR